MEKTNILSEEIYLVIPGNPIVKKSQAKHGIYRKDKKTGRIMQLSSPITYYTSAYKEWAKVAITKCYNLKCKLDEKYNLPIISRVNLKCLFFLDRNYRVDLSALYEGVQDLLIGHVGLFYDKMPGHLYQILYDDSSDYVAGHDGSRVFLDPTNPRTEVYIQPYRI